MIRLAVALVIASAVTLVAQQTPARPVLPARPGAPAAREAAAPAGTARISGRVLRGDTGAPLRDAQVMLSGRLLRRAITDEQGRYEFTDLPDGQYSLQASHGGYVALTYGQRRAFEAGRPFALRDGEVMERVDLALPRGGVISGRVTDDLGGPVTGAEIRIERYQFGPGGRELATFGLAVGQGPFEMRTNDRGEYRVYGLAPGEYVVSARFRLWGSDTVTAGQAHEADVVEGFLPTYYPGSEHPQAAQAVAVGVGQEATAHFSMVPGRRVRIGGFVQDSNGRPAAGLRVSLRETTATSSSRTDGGAVAPDGSFRIGNVAPGTYTLTAEPAAPGPGAEVATMPLTVSTSDVTDVRLTTRPGVRMRGRVEWDGTSPRPAGTMRVNTTSARPRIGPLGDFTFTYLDTERGTVREDGTFEMDGIIGPVLFRLLPPPPPPWTMKAVIADGVDITDSGAEASELAGAEVHIVFTDRATEVSGSVRNDRGEPVSDYVVVLLPQEAMEGIRATRYTRTVRPDQDGVFEVRALPPGRYVAAATESIEQGGEWDPAVQKIVRASGRAFTLAEGQTLALSLEMLR